MTRAGAIVEPAGTWGDPADLVLRNGKIITAAGVSAGLDMALYLAGEIAGKPLAEAIQLGLEYDPHPPFDSGSPQKASEATINLLKGSFVPF